MSQGFSVLIASHRFWSFLILLWTRCGRGLRQAAGWRAEVGILLSCFLASRSSCDPGQDEWHQAGSLSRARNEARGTSVDRNEPRTLPSCGVPGSRRALEVTVEQIGRFELMTCRVAMA
jgi:hypothetical protein